MDDGALFALDEVSLRRGGAIVLDTVTLRIPGSAVTALAGTSGSGKSSLLRLLVRLDEPSAGAVRLGGRPLASYDVLELRRRVQHVTQQATLVTDVVADELRVGRPDLTDDEAITLTRRVGLNPTMLASATRGLSGGEAQRVCLARALALDPEVLLLDEPTSALDEGSTSAIEAVIGEHVAAGGAAVLVSHDSALVRRLARHVVTIDRGGIATAARTSAGR